MNIARTLLNEKSLSNIFWAEVVACSVYLLNRSPTTSLKMKVPQEAWSGKKLNVAHLRTFRCIAYTHIHSHDNSTSSGDSSCELQNQRTQSLREIHQQLDGFEQHNLFSLMSCQPTSFKEATKEPHWVQAMNQEIDSIEKNKTWDLVDFPSHKKSICVKLVYKTKINEKG
jgi:hypothetical protein